MFSPSGLMNGLMVGFPPRSSCLSTPSLCRPQHSQAFPLNRQQAERVTHRGATGESPGISS